MKDIRRLNCQENLPCALLKHWFMILLLTLCGFVFLLTEIMVNIRAVELWSADWLLFAGVIGIFCLGGGVLSYLMLQRWQLMESGRRVFLTCAGGLFFAGIGAMLLTHELWSVIAGFAAVYAVGFLGADVYACTACILKQSGRARSIAGISLCIAVCLQYVVRQETLVERPFLPLLLGAGILLTGVLLWCLPSVRSSDKMHK